MFKMLFLNEPMDRNSISPLQYKVTMESESKFSCDNWELKKYDSLIDQDEELIDKHDKWKNDLWSDSVQDDE